MRQLLFFCFICLFSVSLKAVSNWDVDEGGLLKEETKTFATTVHKEEPRQSLFCRISPSFFGYKPGLTTYLAMGALFIGGTAAVTCPEEISLRNTVVGLAEGSSLLGEPEGDLSGFVGHSFVTLFTLSNCIKHQAVLKNFEGICQAKFFQDMSATLGHLFEPVLKEELPDKMLMLKNFTVSFTEGTLSCLYTSSGDPYVNITCSAH